jgi:murein DD-endopeptidase MepM/ murein hydrolase activator NlpD
MGKLTEVQYDRNRHMVAASQARMKNVFTTEKLGRFWKAAKKEIRETFHVRNTVAALAVLLLSTVGISTIIDRVGTTESVYRVYIDGKYFGVVRDKALIEETVAAFGPRAKAHVDFQNVHQSVVTTSESVVAAAIEESTKTIVDMVAIRVNNKDIAYVKDEATAKQLLDKLRTQFGQANAKATVTFSEKVDTVKIHEDKGKLVSPEMALTLITQGKNEHKTYVVSRGDSLWDIAAKNNVTVDQLHDANPNIHNIDEIAEGEKINLNAYEPLINVNAVSEETRDITTNYEIEYKDDDTLAKGQQKVLEKGSEGKKKQVVRVTRKNGQVTKEDILSEQVVAEPKKEVIAKGTKVSAGVTTYSGSDQASASGNWAWPIAGGYISSQYGENRGGKPHNAIDIAAPAGTAVYASNDGTVISSGDKGDGYGNCIIISHGNGIVSMYGHLSSFSVSAGQTVQKGQRIGGVGSTGWSTGNHLHYEVRVGGRQVNPSPYM